MPKVTDGRFGTVSRITAAFFDDPNPIASACLVPVRRFAESADACGVDAVGTYVGR
jgi:hypothetical protein